MMNNVILIGRLTRDPEIRYSNNSERSIAVARFSLAVDRRKKSEDMEQSADFIPCVAFNSTAEFIEKYLHQGSKIALRGRLQSGSYTNADGQTVYTLDVLVNEIEFAESKNSGERQAPNTTAGDGFMNIPDDVGEGLPFN